MPITLQRMLDVGPGSDDRAQHDQTKREKCQTRHGAAKPKHLAVCGDDDGQVLEDGIHGNGEKLYGLAAGVDHSNKKERDGKP